MTNLRSVLVRGPDDGEKVYAGGDLYRFLAKSGDTDGCYAIWEAIVPPGGGPPPHLHRKEEEGFYVIAGEVMVYAEGEAIKATPGAFVQMPKGSKHWFRNETDQNAKMLVLVAPGGMEGLFESTGSPVVDAKGPIPPLSDDEKKRIGAAAPGFGIELFHP